MELFLETLNVYTWTIITFIVGVYCEAGLLEIIKKAMEKWDEKYKAGASMALSLVLSGAFVCLIYVGLPHPGNIALLPVWFALFYVCQYWADFMGGVKALAKTLGTAKAEKAEKAPKVRYAKFPVDADGRPLV